MGAARPSARPCHVRPAPRLVALSRPAPYPRRSKPRHPLMASHAPAEALAAIRQGMRAGWEKEAACRGTPTEVFYPQPMSASSAAPAKRICRGCPVRESCLRFALACVDRQGIFGGTTPAERRVLHYNVAAAALSLAQRDGVRATALRLDTRPQVLYRARDLWGLGRPSRTGTKAVG
jgi:Transcription factor WhiB